jgi:hypothetical protein
MRGSLQFCRKDSVIREAIPPNFRNVNTVVLPGVLEVFFEREAAAAKCQVIPGYFRLAE